MTALNVLEPLMTILPTVISLEIFILPPTIKSSPNWTDREKLAPPNTVRAPPVPRPVLGCVLEINTFAVVPMLKLPEGSIDNESAELKLLAPFPNTNLLLVKLERPVPPYMTPMTLAPQVPVCIVPKFVT